MENMRDLTTGSISRKLFAFAMPIVAINLLQAIYNIVDMIIVGQFCGKSAMSAVSIGGQVTHLVLAACNGIANGAAVYVGQLFGARRTGEYKSVVGSLMSFMIIAALLLSSVIILLRIPILRALNTPEECFADTVSYLCICAAGTVFIYVYNTLSGVLRGIGESLNPMLYVLITTIENIVLDLVLVGVFDMGAAGAAWATIICQLTSMILVTVYTKRKTSLFDFRLSSFKICWEKLWAVLKVGLPQAIQYVATNISFLFISALINTFGVSAAAAAGAANKVWTFGTMPGRAVMSAEVTMTAQNHPKKNYDRIIKGMFWGMLISLSFSMVFFILCQAAPAAVYRLFTSDPSVAEAGISYLRFYSISFFDEVIMFCMFGILTGSGYTTVTMACSVISAFAVRYAFAYILSSFTSLGFNGIALAYSIAPLVGIAISSYFLVSGRWKNSRVKV